MLRSTAAKLFCAALTLALLFGGARGALSACTPAPGIVPGKDGVFAYANSNAGIVNSYYPGVSASAGSSSVSVGAADARGYTTPSISAGDLVLIIQMQDADCDWSNSSSYGGSSAGTGYTALNSSGLYEYAAVTGYAAGTITLSSPLLNSYHNQAASGSSGQKTFQVIRVPQYSSSTLSGTLTAPPWNGATGGVFAIDVAGNLEWGGSTINLTGRGFRGAGGISLKGAVTGYLNTDQRTPAGNANAGKGEGIAGTPRYLFNETVPGASGAGTLVDNGSAAEGYPNGSFAMGAPGNAGGGGTDGNPAGNYGSGTGVYPTGNDMNTGGGGGGAYSVGGMGGYAWTPLTPPGPMTGGNGGYSVPMGPARLTMGGGGGAGTTNDGTGTPGAGLASSGTAGGGIALIRTKTIGAIGSGTGTINANGTNGNASILNDASGGGGGGGAVLILASAGGGSVGNVTVSVKGGNGGSNSPGAGVNPHGPGGGGGGGFAVFSATPSPLPNVAGGANGTTNGSSTSTPPYGSTTSAGGYQILTLAPGDVPGVCDSALDYPSLTVTKVTGQSNTVQGGTTSYTITVKNAAANGTARSVSIIDKFVAPAPFAPFTYASTQSIVTSGGATQPVPTAPVAGATSPTWGGFVIPGGGSVSVTFTAAVPVGTAPGTYQNSATVSYEDPTRTAPGQTVTPGGTYAAGGVVAGSNYNSSSSTQEDVTVWLPATVTKSFNPTSVNPGGVSLLSISVSNPNATPLTSAAFTDSYPLGLSNTATPGAAFTPASVSAGCLGALSAPANGGSVGLSSGFVPAGATCTITVNVSFTTAGSYANSFAVGAFSNNLNVTNTAAASATLLTRPAITKSFAPAAVNNGVNSTMSFSIVNPNGAGNDLHLAGFSDPFPSGFLGGVANGGQLVASGGTISVAPAGCTGFLPTSIAANATSLTMSAGTIPAGTTCTVSLQVKSATTGYYPNTAGGVSSTETPLAGPSSSAALGVGVITVAESFAPGTIKSGASSTLSFTLSNPTGVAQSAGSFSDTLAGMQVSANQTVGGTCTWGSGAPTLTAGQSALSFSGINIPAAGCTVTLSVSSATPGVQSNATATGVSTALLSAGPVSAAATLNVITPPGIAEAFSPGIIQGGATPAQSSTLTFTLSNPNNIPLTGASFSDTLTGMQVTAAGAAGGSCAGASGNSFSAGATSLSFTGLTIPTGGAGCTVTVNVTAAAASSSAGYPNSAGGVSSNEANTGAPSGAASLVVTQAAVITKGFAPATIVPGGTSTVTFTLANPSAIALTGASFSDTLSGMQISATGPAGGSCTGAPGNSFSAAQTGLISFSGLTLPASPATCTVSVVVTAPAAGSFPNTASGVTANETPVAGAPSNSPTLTVLYPPQLAMALSPGYIQTGVVTPQSSTVTLTLTNPNAGTSLSNVAFSDTLANLKIFAAAAAGGTCSGASSNSFSAGQTGVLNFTGITIPAAGSCTVTYVVTAGTVSPAGGYPNTTSGATSTASGALNLPAGAPSNTAYLSSFQAPTLAKSFGPSAIATNGTSTITFTLSNPNPTPLTGAFFSDPFPTNLKTTAVQQYYINGTYPGPLTVSNRGTCAGAIPAGGSTAITTLTFNGIVIPASGSCTVMVDTTTGTAGNYINTAGGITTDQTLIAGSGASDTLSVGRISISKSFNPALVPVGTSSLMTLYLENPTGGNVTKVAFTDNTVSGWPAGMTIAASPAATNSCGGTLTATSGDNKITLAAVTGSGFGANCTITVPVNISAVGSYTNQTSGVSANGLTTGTASNVATLLGIATPTITKSFTAPGIDLFDPSTITYTITNPNGVALSGATFTDSFSHNPTSGTAGYTVASTAFGGTCTGVTGLPAAGASTLTPVIASLLPGSCTITVPVTASETTGPFPIAYGSVSLTGVTVTLTSSPSTITATGAAPSIPTLTVSKLPLTVSKTVNAPNATPGSLVSYTINYSNPNLSMSYQNLVLTDTVPTYTTFQSASCGALPAGITSCSIAAPAVGSTGTTVTWTLGGTLNAGASGTLGIQVQLK